MSTTSVKHIVVPGTFDPITLGHLDVVRRAKRICPKLTVAVASSAAKGGTGPSFSLDERVEMVEEALAEAGLAEGSEVLPMTGLLVDFCAAVQADAVVKGLRAATDFEYELQQADLNSRLAPELESIFVMSHRDYGYISSSIVRELASFGADVSMLVPPCVISHLEAQHVGE